MNFFRSSRPQGGLGPVVDPADQVPHDPAEAWT